MLLLFIRLLYYDEDKISVNFPSPRHSSVEVNQLLSTFFPPKAKASVDELFHQLDHVSVFILFPLGSN